MLGRPDPSDLAYAFHEMLLEVLKQLNRSEERAGSVDGLELPELARAMQGFWTHHVIDEHLDHAVALLQESGLIRHDDRPVYAWDRRRTVGRRYVITPLGKSYLVRQLEETDRIR